MRRFRYRLERLLTIRAYVEREWELKLARATGVVIGTKTRIAEAREGIARSFGPGTPPGEERGVDVALLYCAERFRQGMQARIDALEDELVVQEADLEKVRGGYLEASRKRKILDKLKEHQQEEARRTQNREEIEVLNDIATSRASRWDAAGVSARDAAGRG